MATIGLEISRTHGLIKDALDYRAARQDMIASNIANADTPFYRPRDVKFEDALAAKSRPFKRAFESTLTCSNR